MYTVIFVENKELAEVFSGDFPQTCAVRQVRNVAALRQALATEPADLVLLDLDLPGSAMAETRTCLQSLEDSTVLLLADQAGFDLSHPLTAISAADYLLKPYTRQELTLTLEETIHRCALRRSAGEKAQEDSQRLSFVREKIGNFIRDHYREELSMQMVAQVMNYSETHFCRLFKQCFKVNFSAYLNEFRVEQAKQLLLATNRNVKEIALDCGYRDTSYFIRVFKRFTGVTPMDYRLHGRSMLKK